MGTRDVTSSDSSGACSSSVEMTRLKGAVICSPLSRTNRPGPAVPSPVGEGRYVARELLGTGARKEVWLATDSRLDRDIALAIVPGADLDDAGRNRLDREAKVIARLGDHPNVVSVIDVGTEGS